MTAKKIYQRIGLSDDEFSETLWQTALDYIELLGKGEQALKTAAFWKWWRMQWHIYDRRFMKSPVIGYALKTYDKKKLYIAYHSAWNKQETYESFIYLLTVIDKNNDKKNAASKQTAACHA